MLPLSLSLEAQYRGDVYTLLIQRGIRYTYLLYLLDWMLVKLMLFIFGICRIQESEMCQFCPSNVHFYWITFEFICNSYFRIFQKTVNILVFLLIKVSTLRK